MNMRVRGAVQMILGTALLGSVLAAHASPAPSSGGAPVGESSATAAATAGPSAEGYDKLRVVESVPAGTGLDSADEQ